MRTIYIVEEETNVDGEIYYNSTPCANFKKAKEVMNEIIDLVDSDSHFRGFRKDPSVFIVEQDDMSFSIADPYDCYWEEINITEKFIQE